MTSPSLIHFQDANTITRTLSSHPLLKLEYFEEKGITKAISDLAGKRFAKKECSEPSVKIGTLLLIEDLKNGKDGFEGDSIPNLGKLGLSGSTWMQISMNTEKALLDCGEKV